MSAVASSPVYTRLLAKAAPRIIRTEAENERYIETLNALEQKRSLSREEKELADLLTLLIENFEEKQYQLPRATPVQALTFLMEQRGLRQRDMVGIFGARSTVSEVMGGKRELSKAHIRQLSDYFHVSPEIFF